MHPEWARELRDACLQENLRRNPAGLDDEAEIAFFFKQWGSWAPVPDGADWREGDTAIDLSGRTWEAHSLRHATADLDWMRYAGAAPKSGGRSLDGRTWDEMPATREATVS